MDKGSLMSDSDKWVSEGDKARSGSECFQVARWGKNARKQVANPFQTTFCLFRTKKFGQTIKHFSVC